MNRLIQRSSGMGNRIIGRIYLGALAALFMFPLQSARADTDEVVAMAGKLSGAAREKFLVEGAKREGNVQLVTTLRAEEVTHLLNVFSGRYPFIRGTAIRGGSDRNFARVEQESRAGKLTSDLWHINATFFSLALRNRLIASYLSPESAAYAARFRRKEGNFVAVEISVGVLGYNRRLVPDQEAPKTYQDLLNPKWKAKISMDESPERELIALIIAWGKDRAFAFMKSLLRQEIQIRRGHVLRAQLLCAGEFEISFELNAHSIYPLIHKGCPIGTVPMVPIPAQPGGLAVIRGGPNPHAAILLYDWILSKEGMTAFVSMGRVGTRADVKSPYREIDALQKSEDLALIMPERSAELESAAAFIKQYWK
jgi:iron(III) transport system substrate-binding protein